MPDQEATFAFSRIRLRLAGGLHSTRRRWPTLCRSYSAGWPAFRYRIPYTQLSNTNRLKPLLCQAQSSQTWAGRTSRLGKRPRLSFVPCGFHALAARYRNLSWSRSHSEEEPDSRDQNLTFLNHTRFQFNIPNGFNRRDSRIVIQDAVPCNTCGRAARGA